MNTTDTLLAVLDASERRRAERRRFIKFAGGATLAAGGASLLAACGADDEGNGDTVVVPSPTPTPTPSTAITEGDVLNFALNLEYLEAQFYSFAAYGTGLPASMLTGSGAQGAVTGGRAVDFSGEPVIGQYAREIANDEIAHVNYLRNALGATARVAQPAINIDGSATGAFTAAARAAGVVGATETFDPYSSPNFFLLGAFIFEDVGVTAYKGAITSITTRAVREAASGVLAAEAYHAGLLRTLLYGRGIDVPLLRTASTQISDARDSLDGPADLDQGVVGTATMSNIVPTDTNGLAFSRTAGQVLNIVYLNRAATATGGFFPAGVNGTIRTSAAS